MADLTLSDGREIDFDLRKITLREWRSLVDGEATMEQEDKIAANVSGLSLDEYKNLSMYDISLFWQAFHQKRQEPVDPNSAGGPSSSSSSEKTKRE